MRQAARGPQNRFDMLGGSKFRLRQGFGKAKTLVRRKLRRPAVRGPKELREAIPGREV